MTKGRRGLTSEHLDLLLARLHPDRERAGEEYQILHQKLIAFFQFRGCLRPEECADETIDRVAKKIFLGEEIEKIPAYTYTVAKFVFREYLKQPDRAPVEFDPALPSPFDTLDELEKRERQACLNRCLGELGKKDASILIRYWHHDEKSNSGARRALAEELNVSPTALRLRILRIRARFMDCYKKCTGNSQIKK